jgi:hypothetical protein
MDQPNSKFKTMGTSNVHANNVSGAPERGKLVKKKNTAAGNNWGKTGVKPRVKVTSRSEHGIPAKMPAWKDPQIGPTQGSGRLFKAAINRTAPNFTDGMSDHN